jgi:putative cardiolipin synthase
MSASPIIKRSYFFILILVLSACSSDPKYQPIDEDFCAKIHPAKFTPLSKQLEPFHEQLLKQTGVVALEEGDASMIARAWLTESAESTIDIQYFIFSADNIGLIAVDYLLRAADRGVKVRIVVDDIMVEADADDLIALDRHPNMEIKIYNPIANVGKNLPAKLYKLTTDFGEFNQRMHNKTFIVDGQVAITGGRNMADEYFDYDHEYNFRDRDVLLIGQVTHTMQHSFEQFWTSTLSVPVTELVDVPDAELNLKVKYEYLRQYACNPQNFWPQIREKIASVPDAFERMQQSDDLIWTDSIFFVSDVPGKNTG